MNATEWYFPLLAKAFDNRLVGGFINVHMFLGMAYKICEPSTSICLPNFKYTLVNTCHIVYPLDIFMNCPYSCQVGLLVIIW